MVVAISKVDATSLIAGNPVSDHFSCDNIVALTSKPWDWIRDLP